MSVKLLPFILIVVVGCNENKTGDNLRDEVERKNFRNSTHKKQVAASEQAADEARISLAQSIADNNLKVVRRHEEKGPEELSKSEVDTKKARIAPGLFVCFRFLHGLDQRLLRRSLWVQF